MSIDITQSKEQILHFLREHGVGVLSTADRTGKPHAATVYVAHDEQLNFYFLTKKETQKYSNLQTNPQAAIAIFDPKTQTTVQVEGPVTELTSPDKTEWVFHEIWTTALKTSQSGVLPTASLHAGGYAVYRLSSPSVRIATFNPPDPSQADNIFHIVT